MRSTFRSAAFAALVLSFFGTVGCGKEEVKPDPALPGNVPGTSTSTPADTSSPPPNSGNTSPSPKATAGTLQDMCRSQIIKKALGGVAKTFVKFTKDGNTILVDVCRSGGAEAVAYEKFNFKDRTDLHVATNTCPTGSSKCWFKVYDLKTKSDDLGYSTLSEMGITGRYKTGESTSEIPGDAQVTFGVLLDDSGGVSSTAVAAAKKYQPKAFQTPVDVSGINARLDKLDERLTKVEADTSRLVIAMAAYSDMVRRDEAM